MDNHSDAETTVEIRFPEWVAGNAPEDRVVSVPTRSHRDRAFPAPSLSIISGPAWSAIVAVTIVPLLLVLLIAIHPWTFRSPGSLSAGSGPAGVGQVGDPFSAAIGAVTQDEGAESDTDSDTGSGAVGDDQTSSQALADPDTEAAAVTDILQQAADARQSVVAAVQDAAACGDLPSDQQALLDAESTRDALGSSAATTPVDALSGAADVPDELSVALSDSATADADFAGWVGDLESSCDPATAIDDSQYQQAVADSRQADDDKQTLLSTWNPVAQQYGQPTFAASDI